jgi:outer membrane protein assembly factor BamB
VTSLRSGLHLGVAVAATLVTLAFGSLGAQADDQAVAYQIDPAHTGGQPADELYPPLSQVWSVDLGGSVSYPLIANGIAYVTVANTNTSGSRLYALNLYTGATLWGPIQLGGPYGFSAAAYDAGQVFAINFSGGLQAFDAITGAPRWSVQMPGQYAFTSPPTATGGVVYVGGAGSGGTVYAVSEADGTVTWTASVMNGDHSSPAVSGTGVYVSYACNQAYGFDTVSGSLAWHYATGCEGGGGKTTAAFGGRIYVRDSSSGNLVLDAATGSQIGTFPSGAGISVPIPAFSGSRGFFFDGSVLRGIDLATNTVQWSFAGDGSLASAPVVAGRFLYEVSTRGNLYALDPATGATVFSTNVGPGVSSPDEQNAFQLTGLGAAEGVLIVPAGNRLVALSSQVMVSPPSLSFSSTQLGRTSTAQVTVANHGAAATLTGVSATGDFSAPNSCASLAAGASCAITVTFIPSRLGTSVGTLTITDSASSGPHTVQLSGLAGYGPPDHILLSPRDAATTAGVAVVYKVEAFDSTGNDLGDVTTQATITLLSQSVSTPIACPQAACSTTYATQPRYLDMVTASFTPAGGTALTDATSLTVNPGPIDHLVLQPNNSGRPAGVNERYYLFPEDQYSNRMADVSSSAQFSVTAPATCQGYYCGSTTAGSYAVTATYGGFSVSTRLTISPDVPTTLAVLPAVSTIAAGAAQTYTAQAFDEYGNSIGDVTSTTAFSLQPGSCTGNVCTATKATAPGTSDTVSATWKAPAFYPAISGSAQLGVVPGAVSGLSLTGPASTSAGSAVTVNARGADAYGNDIGDVSGQAAFAITPDGSCQANTCSATRAGTHVVSASYQSASASLSLSVTPGPAASLQLSPANATISVGSGQAYTAEAYDQYGNDAGNVTAQTSFTAGGSPCGGNVCTPANAAPNAIEVDGSYQAELGTALLVVRPVVVTVDQVTATPISPETSIQFNDVIQVSARVTLSSACCGAADGTVGFTTGKIGIIVPVAFPAGATSAVVTADYPLSADAIPGGAGPYTLTAGFHSANANYSEGIGTMPLAVLREAATLALSAPFYVSDRTSPNLAVTVDQRENAGDSTSIDYSVTPVWIRFDVFTPGAASPLVTRYAPVGNAPTWSTTGLGTAGVSIPAPLADGVYEVTAGIVASSTSPLGNSSSYLASDLLRVFVTSAPSTASFAAGGGYIKPDSTSNAGSRNGYFGFLLKPGKPAKGVVAYTFRTSMDVGGGNVRDVDVVATSTSVGSLTLKPGGAGGTIAASGALSVRYLDAITGADYAGLDFSGGSYQLNATDAGSTGDKYLLVLKRPNGTSFHSSSSAQAPIAAGVITVNAET